MQGLGVRRFHDPIELLEVPAPDPKEDELLIRVRAAGVNPFDSKVADGILSPRRPHVFPVILGMDGAGEVERVGSRVRGFTPGDPVFGDLIHDPIGEGTFAEHTVVPEGAAVTKKPSELGWEAAAAMPLAGMTALLCVDELGLPARATLLVVGASGGIGSFVVSLARSRGLHVIAAVRGDGGDRAKRLGAAEVLDMTASPLPEQVRRAHPSGIDGFLHLIGDAGLFRELSRAVRKGGSAVTTTYVADHKDLAALGLRGGNVSLEPSRELLDRITQEVVAGHAEVPVETTAPLREGIVLLAKSRAGELRGKAVLIP